MVNAVRSLLARNAANVCERLSLTESMGRCCKYTDYREG
jgi:hypothetical protein